MGMASARGASTSTGMLRVRPRRRDGVWRCVAFVRQVQSWAGHEPRGVAEALVRAGHARHLTREMAREICENSMAHLDVKAFVHMTMEARMSWHRRDMLLCEMVRALLKIGNGSDNLIQSALETFIDSLEGTYKETFLLHYNFPPYSVGETGRMGSPGRREIGHGKLAWRALQAVLPAPTDFPYTIRVVSEITESNGSSSMASVCGGSLSMMDAGVPLKAPVAGVAMGLVLEDGDNWAVLTDILGDEDHLGDMDFKVAGTANGITSLQMDIKVQGITPEIMEKALAQAKDGRMHILGEMAKALSEGRAKAVVAALTAQGIDAARLSAAGFGDSQPVADNGTEEGKVDCLRATVLVEDHKRAEVVLDEVVGNQPDLERHFIGRIEVLILRVIPNGHLIDVVPYIGDRLVHVRCRER